VKKTVLLLFAVAVFFGCSLDKKETADNTILVVDRSSNQALSSYETDNQGRVIRTQTYESSGQVARSRTFLYDSRDLVSDMVEHTARMATRSIHYFNEIDEDGEGRVQKITVTSSEGKVIEHFFGYDEKGTLRGTVTQYDRNRNNLLLRDYPYAD
jgi:hypothetical protein